MLSVILIPGLIGGVILALLLRRFRTGPQEPPERLRLEFPSPGLINMARIRVEGFGGLGLFAMAVVVAIFVPRIRAEMSIALILGIVLAAALILLRRRGPLPSSSDRPGAHAMFEMETGSRPRTSAPDRSRDSDRGGNRRLVTAHPR